MIPSVQRRCTRHDRIRVGCTRQQCHSEAVQLTLHAFRCPIRLYLTMRTRAPRRELTSIACWPRLILPMIGSRPRPAAHPAIVYDILYTVSYRPAPRASRDVPAEVPARPRVGLGERHRRPTDGFGAGTRNTEDRTRARGRCGKNTGARSMRWRAKVDQRRNAALSGGPQP